MIANLIAEGKLQQALDEAFSLASADQQNTLILLKSRYARNENDNNMGILTRDAYQMERNRITTALLFIVKGFSKEAKAARQPNNRSSSKENYIYFSYAWANEKNPKIEELVNKIYDSLTQDGYQVKRDKMDLGYQGLISKFMQEIGESQLVLVALSEKYLYSPYCMDELFQIYANAQAKKDVFAERVLPVWMEGIDLNARDFRMKLYDHWQNEEEAQREYVRKYAEMVSNEEYKQYEIIKKIKQNISVLLAFIADMNALTEKLLSENDFARLKETIEKRLSKL